MSNSKQINFFITKDDSEAINDYLETQGNIIIYPDNNEDKTTHNLNIEQTYKKPFQIYITKKEFKSNLVLLKNSNKYSIDVLKSNIIEFSRGGIFPYSNKILHRGRFYIVTGYYDESGNIISKDKEFIVWANNIFTKIKKTFLNKTTISKDYYFSENAIEWYKENNASISIDGQKLVSSQ